MMRTLDETTSGGDFSYSPLILKDLKNSIKALSRGPIGSVTRVMSETQTIPTTLPPIIVAFITGIKPSFNVLAVCSVWLGVSIPLLFILSYFSSGGSRNKPLFFFNAVSILLGITMGFMNIVILVRNAFNAL